MPTVTSLAAYTDEAGNEIVYEGDSTPKVKIKFTGSNNRLVVDAGARIGELIIDFDCDNGRVQIGKGLGGPPVRAAIRVGQDSTVTLGDGVSMTTVCAMSATEGSAISIGRDVMFASENQVRADDGHPIFDVRTGRRVNVSRSITVGDHVWLGRGAVVLGGASIGQGSVVGYGSIVTKAIPNNCIAAGVPAKVVRRDIAWERPHLSLTPPFYKPDASTVRKSRYWDLTSETAPVMSSAPGVGSGRRARSSLERTARGAARRIVTRRRRGA